MINNAALISLVHIYFHIGADSSEQVPRSAILGLKGKFFTTGAVPLCIPTARDESACFFTALPTEYTAKVLNFCLSDR